MKKFLFTLSSLLWIGWSALAQESNVSQFYHTPFLTNPGMIGSIEQTSIIANHRSQTVEAGKTYATSSISGFHPISLGNHTLGVGASFVSDRVADFISTNGGLIGTAYRVQLASRHALSLGAQAGFFNRKLNSTFNYTTDSQFINGNYNGDAPTGEYFIAQSSNFMTLSTGLHWQMLNELGQPIAYVGGAIFNFNEPNVGFDNEALLPISLKVTAGLQVYQTNRLSVMPNLRWIHHTKAQLLHAGSWFRYDLSQSVEYPQYISLGTWYGNNRIGTMALEYAKSNYLIGLSYDVPMRANLNTFQQGGIFEIALSLRLGNRKRPAFDSKTQATSPSVNPSPK